MNVIVSSTKPCHYCGALSSNGERHAPKCPSHYGIHGIAAGPVPRPKFEAADKTGEGRKDDTGKEQWSLLPTDAVRAIIKVLTFGAVKYAPRNWELGMDWNRPYDALQRHMTAWWEGEEKDSETGFSHLWHAGCCILFLIAFEIRGVGKDNRPKTKTGQN